MGRGLFLDRADYRRFFPVFVVEGVLGSFLYMYGLTHAPLAIGATLSSLAPVISVPVAVFLGWEAFSLLSTLAIGLVVVGVTFLVL